MKSLKQWLKEERGRAAALSRYLGLTEGRISQFADTGVPDKYKLRISEYTNGEVTIEALIQQRAMPELMQAARERS